MEMYRRTYAEINLDHLAYNIQTIQQAFPQASFLCPMVKANAYGHGDLQLARFLERRGIRHLGVCLIEEGILLRNFGVQADILVFRGFDQEGARKILEYNLTPVVSTWEQLEHLEAIATSAIGIHLKFDTGMNRLGFHPDEAQKLMDRLWENKKIRLIALVTHLLNGDDALENSGRSAHQLATLNRISQKFKALGIFCHALNSAGIINLMEYQKSAAAQRVPDHPLALQNWGLRPGLMLYGYNPLGAQSSIRLKPVMTLKSQVGSYRKIKKGESVSYGGTWIAPRDSVIAVVPIGYADGYHRILSNKASVLFMGKRVPVVGNICMDYLMVDVTDVVGAEDMEKFKDGAVTLFGAGDHRSFLSPEELAPLAGTITWEILTSVGERVPRVYIGGDEKDRS